MPALQIKEMQYFSTTCILENGWKCVGMQFVGFFEGFYESQFYILIAGGDHMSLQLFCHMQRSHYLRQMFSYLICIYFQITILWSECLVTGIYWNDEVSGSAFPSGFHQSVTFKWWAYICLLTAFTQRMATLSSIFFK